MLTSNFRHIVGLVEAYRAPLLFVAVVMAVGTMMAAHLNSTEEATRALRRVYDSSPHVEVVVVPSTRPTR